MAEPGAWAKRDGRLSVGCSILSVVATEPRDSVLLVVVSFLSVSVVVGGVLMKKRMYPQQGGTQVGHAYSLPEASLFS